MTLKLDAEQERDILRIANEPSLAALDASTMSAGKTVVALAVAKRRGAKVILVCGPLQTRGGWAATAQNGWEWSNGAYEDYADLPFRWIRNSKGGVKARALFMMNTPGIYFIGHEYAVAISWKLSHYRKLLDEDGRPKVDKVTGKPKLRKVMEYNVICDRVAPHMLIVDEIHRGNINADNMRYKTLDKIDSYFMLGLSGTPHGNRFDGIYPVSKMLWPNYVDDTMQRFKRRWCEHEYDPHSWDHMKVTGELVEGAYFKWLPCVVRREWEYEGVLDSQGVYVELSSEQRKAYGDLENSMVTWLEDHPFVIEFPQTLRIRLRQATLAMFYEDTDGVVQFRENARSTKLGALYQVLENDFQGEPAIVMTDSRKFAEISVARLNKKYGTVAELWSGHQTQIGRDKIKARFMAHETKYVVMVIKAGGTGTDGLQFGSHNIAIMSMDDSRIENEQAIARTVRRGQGPLVRLRYIMAIDTYDEGILHGQLAAKVRMRKSMDLTGAG